MAVLKDYLIRIPHPPTITINFISSLTLMIINDGVMTFSLTHKSSARLVYFGLFHVASLLPAMPFRQPLDGKKIISRRSILNDARNIQL